MSESTTTNPAAQRYDAARHRAHDDRLPPGYPLPQPTTAWPAENVALLERFRLWLLSSSTSLELVNVVYIPTAGNALGLNLKPHSQLDLDTDLERALERLERLNPNQARVVELRCYGGLTVPEVAEVLEVSVATVNRSWRAARSTSGAASCARWWCLCRWSEARHGSASWCAWAGGR